MINLYVRSRKFWKDEKSKCLSEQGWKWPSIGKQRAPGRACEHWYAHFSLNVQVWLHAVLQKCARLEVLKNVANTFLSLLCVERCVSPCPSARMVLYMQGPLTSSLLLSLRSSFAVFSRDHEVLTVDKPREQSCPYSATRSLSQHPVLLRTSSLDLALASPRDGVSRIRLLGQRGVFSA